MKDLFIDLFLENKEFLSLKYKNNPNYQFINLLFDYKIDDLFEKINNNSIKDTKLNILLKSKCYFFKYDLESLVNILKYEKTIFDDDIYRLLRVESLILRKKIHEISGYSGLSEEVKKNVTELYKHKDNRLKSLAKTLEGDNESLHDKYYSSLNCYREAVSLCKDNLRAKIGVAKSLYFIEEYENSEKELINLSKEHLNTPIKKYLGKIYSKYKDFDKAIITLKEILVKDKYYIDVYFDLFDIFRKTKSKETDIIIDDITVRFPYYVSSSQFQFYKALNYYLNDKFVESINLFEQLLKNRFRHIEIEYLMGKMLSKKAVTEKTRNIKDLEEAAYYLDSAIKNIKSEIELLEESEEYNKFILEKLSKLIYKYKYSLGITLSLLKRHDDSINLLLELYKLRPKDFFVIKSLAISYSQSNDFENAIVFFEIAIQISNENKIIVFPNTKAAIYREYSFCLMKKDNYKKAKVQIEKAIKCNPKDYKNYLTLGEILMNRNELIKAKENINIYLNNDNEKKYEDLAKEILKIIDNKFKGGQAVLKKRILLGNFNNSDITSKKISDEEKRFENKILSPRTISGDKSFLVILRKWNSYTPILNTNNSKGGGYFICYQGLGIVIDPGLNFLENFFSEGFSLKDIDVICISHAHNDHMADLESIITLLFKYNNNKQVKDLKILPEHKISLYLNIGSFKKIINYIDLNNKDVISNVVVLNTDTEYLINNNIQLITRTANHNEIISSSYCLSFIFNFPKNKLCNRRNIVFTNDTGYSKKLENELFHFNPDILVAHIGTIKDFEFSSDDFYPKHLGLNGIIKLISKSKSKINIISEFGEELKQKRAKIANCLADVYKKPIIPGEIGTTISIDNLTIKESFSSIYPPTENTDKIEFLMPSDIKIVEQGKVFLFNKNIKDVNDYLDDLKK